MKKFILFLLITVLSIATIGCSNDKPSDEKPNNEVPNTEDPVTQDPVTEEPTGKKPEGDPKDTITNYYTHLDKKEYEDAYNLLSDELKKDTDLESFTLWNSLLDQTSLDKTYEFSLVEEKEDAMLDGADFAYINNFMITKSWLEAYTDKSETYDTEEYVVAENNEWKVYRLKEDFNVKTKIASNYNTLGMMYSYGKGADEDQEKSLEMFTNATDYDDTNYYYYYGMSNTLINLERLDEAEVAANRALELLDENQDDPFTNYQLALSNTNNVLGVISQRKGDVEKALEYYTISLEFNPDNEQAKQNIDRLQ